MCANEQVECTHAHLRMHARAHEYIHTWAAPEKEPGQAADKIPGWLCRGRRSAADAAAAARGRRGEVGELLEGGVGTGDSFIKPVQWLV